MNEKQYDLAHLALMLAQAEKESAEIKSALQGGLDAVVDEYKRQHEEEYARLEELALQAEQLRAQIRELAPVVGEVLGTKKPVPGIGLRTREVLEYAHDEAVAWAINTPEMRPLLTLDRKKAEAVLKPLAKTGVAPAWATIRTETTVTFARDFAAVADELRAMLQEAERALEDEARAAGKSELEQVEAAEAPPTSPDEVKQDFAAWLSLGEVEEENGDA